jgi:hypothetical protein
MQNLVSAMANQASVFSALNVGRRREEPPLLGCSLSVKGHQCKDCVKRFIWFTQEQVKSETECRLLHLADLLLIWVGELITIHLPNLCRTGCCYIFSIYLMGKSNVGDDNYFCTVLKLNFDTGTVRSLGQRAKPSHFFKVYEKFYIFEPD